VLHALPLRSNDPAYEDVPLDGRKRSRVLQRQLRTILRSRRYALDPVDVQAWRAARTAQHQGRRMHRFIPTDLSPSLPHTPTSLLVGSLVLRALPLRTATSVSNSNCALFCGLGHFSLPDYP